MYVFGRRLYENLTRKALVFGLEIVIALFIAQLSMEMRYKVCINFVVACFFLVIILVKVRSNRLLRSLFNASACSRKLRPRQ